MDERGAQSCPAICALQRKLRDVHPRTSSTTKISWREPEILAARLLFALRRQLDIRVRAADQLPERPSTPSILTNILQLMHGASELHSRQSADVYWENRHSAYANNETRITLVIVWGSYNRANSEIRYYEFILQTNEAITLNSQTEMRHF